MKKALVIMMELFEAEGWVWGKDFAFVLSVHDEQQIEFNPETVDEDRIKFLAEESIRKSGEFFNFRCPLDAEAKVGDSWAETH